LFSQTPPFELLDSFLANLHILLTIPLDEFAAIFDLMTSLYCHTHTLLAYIVFLLIIIYRYFSLYYFFMTSYLAQFGELVADFKQLFMLLLG